MRVLFWNCWLLRVGLGPFTVYSKANVRERSTQIGPALSGQHDVMALAEVFDQREIDSIMRGFRQPPALSIGPEARWMGKASGLVTLSQRPVVRTEKRAFRQRGQGWHDTDVWASKGVLMVELDVGLELYSTHLLAGGDLLPRPRRSAVDKLRLAQVDELLATVDEWHRPGNTALVCGDFNVLSCDCTGRELRERMDKAGFDDVWSQHGNGDGHTWDIRAAEGPTQRIDYMFLQRAAAFDVADISVMETPSLSDHAALGITLTY